MVTIGLGTWPNRLPHAYGLHAWQNPVQAKFFPHHRGEWEAQKREGNKAQNGGHSNPCRNGNGAGRLWWQQ